MHRRHRSSFFELVWRAARAIRRGRVATYQDIARRIGRPHAVRAVGNALNKNPYAPAVPCHRVVRSDGQIGGYAGGPGTKKALLRREGVAITNGKVNLECYGVRW
jgi:O-6-methylguanine DNA methyltransferase